jgi:hypothetical protein
VPDVAEKIKDLYQEFGCTAVSCRRRTDAMQRLEINLNANGVAAPAQRARSGPPCSVDEGAVDDL